MEVTVLHGRIHHSACSHQAIESPCVFMSLPLCYKKWEPLSFKEGFTILPVLTKLYVESPCVLMSLPLCYRKWEPLSFKEGFTILPVLTKPKSRGSVRLREVVKFTELLHYIAKYYFWNIYRIKRQFTLKIVWKWNCIVKNISKSFFYEYLQNGIICNLFL